MRAFRAEQRAAETPKAPPFPHPHPPATRTAPPPPLSSVRQVSDAVYKAVMAEPAHSFTFEEMHKTCCKGFGSVPAYFVKGSNAPPPSDLLQKLQLVPNYGVYYFDCPLGQTQPLQYDAASEASKASSKTGRQHPVPRHKSVGTASSASDLSGGVAQ